MRSAILLFALAVSVFGVTVVVGQLASALGPCDNTASSGYDAEETEFLRLVDEYRAQNGVGPLHRSAKLDQAATWMAKDLASHNYFDHTSSDGRSPYQRMADCGYSGGGGENIAGGIGSAADVFAAWKGSPGHNANMLRASFVAIGQGRELGGPYRVYWVTDFGVVDDGGPSPTPTPTPLPPPVPRPRAHLPQLARDGLY